MRVGIDIDDCIYPFVPAVHDVAVKHGLAKGAVPSSWDLHVDYDCPREVLWSKVELAYQDGLLLGRPYPEAVPVLQAIRDAGHTIHLATARSCSREYTMPSSPLLIRTDTAIWLDSHKVPHDTLTFTRDKTLLRVAVFVDDSPANVAALTNAGIPAWLLTRPHNATDREAESQHRVASLAAFARDVLEVPARALGGWL